MYEAILTNIQNVFYEEITKQNLSYISISSLRILYKSKFSLMAPSLGTNAVVVTKVHCISGNTVAIRDMCSYSVNGRAQPPPPPKKKQKKTTSFTEKRVEQFLFCCGLLLALLPRGHTSLKQHRSKFDSTFRTLNKL